MIYGELGTTPLHLIIKCRVLIFWYRIVSGSKDKICYILYQLMHYLYENDLFHFDWIKTVHNTLSTLELPDIWLSHDTFNTQAAFKNKVKTRISDQFKQEWKATLMNQKKCLNYRLYKKNFALKTILTFCHCLYPNIYVNLDVSDINYHLRKGAF